MTAPTSIGARGYNRSIGALLCPAATPHCRSQRVASMWSGFGQLRHVSYASLSGESPGLADVHLTETAEDFVAGLLAAAGE